MCHSAFSAVCELRHFSTLSQGTFLYVQDFSPSAVLLQFVQTLTVLRKALSSLIQAPSIRNANTCGCVTHWSPETSAGAYQPPNPHTLCPPLPAQCHYFIVSLHACDWVVELTLWCSARLAAVQHPDQYRGRQFEFGTTLSQGLPACPSGLYPQSLPVYPSHCLRMHSTASQLSVIVCHVVCYPVTCDHNCRISSVSLLDCMGRFCFPGT